MDDGGRQRCGLVRWDTFACGCGVSAFGRPGGDRWDTFACGCGVRAFGRPGGDRWDTFACGCGVSAFGRPGGAHSTAPPASKRLCQASPMRLIVTTLTNIPSAAISATCGASASTGRPCAINAPQLAAGGGTLKPRNARAPSVAMATATFVSA